MTRRASFSVLAEKLLNSSSKKSKFQNCSPQKAFSSGSQHFRGIKHTSTQFILLLTKEKMNTVSNICHKGNSRTAIKLLLVTTFTAFVSTLHLSITQKTPTKQQRALDYFFTLIKTELANLDKVFQNLFYLHIC